MSRWVPSFRTMIQARQLGFNQELSSFALSLSLSLSNFLEEASHEVLLIDSETRTPYPQHWGKMDYMMMILYIFLPKRCGFLWTRDKTWAGMSPMLASLLHRRKFQNSCTTHDRKRILLQDPRENDDRETQFLQGPTQISRESPFYTCRSAVKKLGVK